ncbi:MAG: hypothetical protein K0S23_1860 [Fluviicola sp.]|nr:hypothetical protein [Fluviicola sp.]
MTQTQKTSRILSLAILILGIVLLIFMITVEDEPGALPLLLILTGTVWFSINQYRIKRK